MPRPPSPTSGPQIIGGAPVNVTLEPAKRLYLGLAANRGETFLYFVVVSTTIAWKKNDWIADDAGNLYQIILDPSFVDKVDGNGITTTYLQLVIIPGLRGGMPVGRTFIPAYPTVIVPQPVDPTLQPTPEQVKPL